MSVKRDVEITHLHIKIENSRTLIVPYDCITFFTCLLRSAHNVTNYTIFTATLNAQPSKVTELQSTFGARFQVSSDQFTVIASHREFRTRFITFLLTEVSVTDCGWFVVVGLSCCKT